MDNFNSNLNPTPSRLAMIRKYTRPIALGLVGLVVAVSFMFYTGGFDALSKIFGTKAGTSLIFAGLNNLQGNSDAADWVLGETVPVAFDGTGTFANFTGIPEYALAETADVGFVSPLVADLDPDMEASSQHDYTSAALDLGTNPDQFTRLVAYFYLANQTDEIAIAYRTADEIEALSSAPFNTINESPTMLPTNESISTITSNLAVGTLSRYLQLKVDFVEFEPTSRPAFYGLVVESPLSEDDTTGGANETANQVVNVQTNVLLTYDATEATTFAPSNARIQLMIANDPSINPIFTQDSVNLWTAKGQYNIPISIKSGVAYAVVITDINSGQVVKVTPFLGTRAEIQTVQLGVFDQPEGYDLDKARREAAKAAQGQSDGLSADLNGDGAVNSLDFAILLNQMGDSSS